MSIYFDGRLIIWSQCAASSSFLSFLSLSYNFELAVIFIFGPFMSSFRCRFKLIYRFYLKFIGGSLVFFRFFWVLHIMPKCDWCWYVSHIATQHTHKPTLYLSLAWNRPILVNLDRKKYQMIKSFWFALVRFQFDRYKIMLEFPPFVREREREREFFKFGRLMVFPLF